MSRLRTDIELVLARAKGEGSKVVSIEAIERALEADARLLATRLAARSLVMPGGASA